MTVSIVTTGTTWVVPDGVYDIDVHVIGGGGSGGDDPANGGGGGAYSFRKKITVTPNRVLYISVGVGGLLAASGTDTWVNFFDNRPPLNTSEGVLAKGGSGGLTGIGGQASQCIGDVVYSGGNGGSDGASLLGGHGGGGGSAGPDGPGRNGGGGFNASISGGGGGGGSNGLLSTPGESVTADMARGGDGGQGPLGTGAGQRGTQIDLSTGTPPTAGVNGGGGGGIYSSTASGGRSVGGAGGSFGIWVDSQSLSQAGPGGGGGGSRSIFAGGRGADYGGGGGGFRGQGGNGVIVFSYLSWDSSTAGASSWSDETPASSNWKNASSYLIWSVLNSAGSVYNVVSSAVDKDGIEFDVVDTIIDSQGTTYQVSSGQSNIWSQ